MAALLEAEGLHKSFGGVAALKDGRFLLEPGSVHALCGGNGAGKSTFLKILMGIEPRDGGAIRLEGREVRFASPREALAAGVAIVEQELSPVPAMTVAENVFLGREPLRRLGRVDFAAMNRATADLLGRLGFDLRPEALMMDLTVAEVQLVEIAKALSQDARVLILDEPTSALGEAEARRLFDAVRRLRDAGTGIIYVSHRLGELFAVADRFTVFRDGAAVASGRMAEVTRDALIEHIVGRPLAEEFVKENAPRSEEALAVEGLSRKRLVDGVSFAARRGEIVALYGLMGAGRTEVLEALFGLARDRTGGRVRVGGREVALRSPQEAMAAGLALVTEDRKGSGLVLTSSVRDNVALPSLRALSRGPVMSPRAERDAARAMIARFGIRAASDRMEVAGLSGGNQQKVVLGKWFLREPRILLLDEPTRGVDVGAKREIYRVMSDFARAGGTVVMASSETDEVLGMADRTVVIRQGRVAGEVAREGATARALVDLAA